MCDLLPRLLAGRVLPGMPPYLENEQAFVESFPRTLRKECLGCCSYKLSEREELQKEVQEYLGYYHYERPPLALDMQTPLAPVCRI